MNREYRLQRRKTAPVASLIVRDNTLRVHVPPADASTRTFATHDAAVDALNAELARLSTKHWTIEQVLTAEAAPEIAPPAAPEIDDLSECIGAASGTITIDASRRTVTAEQAFAALRMALDTVAKHCRELRITEAQDYRAPWHSTVAPWCEAFARTGGRGIERFTIDTDVRTLARQASIHCGDLTQLFRACTDLRAAHLIGHVELESFAHERLEALTLLSDPIGAGTLRAVLSGPCPRLARLALGFSYEAGAAPGADAILIEALRQRTLPALAELHLAYAADGAALLDGLARAPAFGQLRVLSIAGNIFSDEDRGLAVLREHAPALSALERLYLPLEDVMNLDDDGLRAIVPSICSIDEIRPF